MKRVQPKNIGTVIIAAALGPFSMWDSFYEGTKVSVMFGTGFFILTVYLLLMFLWSEVSNFKDKNNRTVHRLYIVLSAASSLIYVPISILLIALHFIYMLKINLSGNKDLIEERPDIRRGDMIQAYGVAITTLVVSSAIFIHYISIYVAPVL